jgi:dimeric dUTPase (all-alpha-NTP-PPase superfamily)
MGIMNKVQKMFEMQDELNKQISPDWKEKDYDWDLAIAMETSELINDHLGPMWKWWKGGTTNMVQAQLEVVDIWHFLMSKIMVDGYYSDRPLWTEKMLSFDNSEPKYLLRDAEHLLHTSAARAPAYDLVIDFTDLLYSMDMDIDSLYALYCGKHTLNTLRQNNGYKDGKYVKIWAGMEDNEHMYDLVMNKKLEGRDLYLTLESIYRDITKG